MHDSLQTTYHTLARHTDPAVSPLTHSKQERVAQLLALIIQVGVDSARCLVPGGDPGDHVWSLDEVSSEV